ncbi:MAG: hypothetical protein ABIP03_03605 [Aquihabitans sp.]
MSVTTLRPAGSGSAPQPFDPTGAVVVAPGVVVVVAGVVLVVGAACLLESDEEHPASAPTKARQVTKGTSRRRIMWRP